MSRNYMVQLHMDPKESEGGGGPQLIYNVLSVALIIMDMGIKTNFPD